eukprot:163329-Amphidinium_carterae.1
MGGFIMVKFHQVSSRLVNFGQVSSNSTKRTMHEGMIRGRVQSWADLPQDSQRVVVMPCPGCFGVSVSHKQQSMCV